MVELAKLNQINEIMEIINSAKAFLKSQGLDQWQDGHPNEEMIIDDIKNNNFYVIKDGEKIVSCAAIIYEADPNYSVIYDGAWLTNNPYYVIHRFATIKSAQNKGYATEIINFVKGKIDNNTSIRIDTHINNIPMQNLLNKNGFILCGKIYLDHIKDNRHLRLAYEYKK